MKKGLKQLSLVWILLGLLVGAPQVFAGMSSSNYQILGDTVDSGGLSTSTNYAQFGAAGEWTGTQTSTNYIAQGGFLNIQKDVTVSLALSSATLALGTLSTGSVATASTNAVVSSDASSGYQLFISESAGLVSGANTIDDVSDGEVTAGAEEYGVRTSGSAGQYNASDTSITSVWKVIATNAAAASSESTTVTVRVGISSATPEGSYSQTLNFAATAQF